MGRWRLGLGRMCRSWGCGVYMVAGVSRRIYLNGVLNFYQCFQSILHATPSFDNEYNDVPNSYIPLLGI